MPKFRPDHSIARNLLRQPGVVALVHDATEEVYQAAVALSGARESSDSFSEEKFSDSLDTEYGKDRTRAFGRVTTDHPGWLSIEFGTSSRPALAPLRRAIEAAGLATEGRRR